MELSQIASFLRLIADVIDSNPQVAKAIKEHLDKNTNLPKTEEISKTTIESNDMAVKNLNESHTLNGETLLTKSREILRGQGKEQLKIYLVEQGENVREILKYGQLDPNRSIRRRKNLNSIIEHIISHLIAQEKSGKTFAGSFPRV
ncbi:hypothetical protein NUACC21_05470 [Scytonema sp. NUACC21]